MIAKALAVAVLLYVLGGCLELRDGADAWVLKRMLAQAFSHPGEDFCADADGAFGSVPGTVCIRYLPVENREVP